MSVRYRSSGLLCLMLQNRSLQKRHSRLVQVVSKRLLKLTDCNATGVLAQCSDILPQCNFLGWRLELNTLYCRGWTESVLEAMVDRLSISIFSKKYDKGGSRYNMSACAVSPSIPNLNISYLFLEFCSASSIKNGPHFVTR
jgi:hypothetical protein